MHHPQTDGASEIMNRMVENYLRCYCNVQQDSWDKLLIEAKFAYNSSINASTGMTPFETDLVRNPKSPLDCLTGAESTNESVNSFRRRLSLAYDDATFAQAFASARFSAYKGQKRTLMEYRVGESEWLSRKLFSDAVSRNQKSKKLGVKRYGPFPIAKLIGKNAVKLELPKSMRIHPVVHVEHATRFKRQPKEIAAFQYARGPKVVIGTGGVPEFVVKKILGHQKLGRGNQWLTLMKGEPQHEATWKPTSDFVDDDGTVTDALLQYIKQKGLPTTLLTRTSTRRGENGETSQRL